MINSINSGYQTQAVESRQQNYRLQQKEYSTKSGDKVTISDSAKQMATIDSFFSELNIPYTPGKSISLNDLKTGFEASSKEFRDNMNSLFLQNGIRLSPPIELTSDSEGKVKVKGDHPQKDKIEKLFEDNPDLTNDFNGLSMLDSLIEAGEEYIEFAKAYDKNPYEAIEKFGHLFNGAKDDFSMIFEKEESANTDA